jgi:DNA recombination protein RmuC
MNEIIIWVILALIVIAVAGLFMIGARLIRMQGQTDSQSRQFENIKDQQLQSREAQLKSLAEMQAKLEQRFGDMQQGIEKRLGEMSQTSIERLAKSNDQIQETLHKRLTEISGQVETRLSKGFEKTNETFTDVVKRLALIDEAQKKITELSSSVVSLQEVLNDKRSRGAFGEAQMMLQVRNALPENAFEEQHLLSNGTRVDCMLFLPEPTGNLAIDAKFPLDSYKTMMDPDVAQSDRLVAEKQFKQDIKKHINDIADKYILPGETSDGALMFIPAEAVFAEIHAHQPGLVEEAQRRRVWMVSPTTMMAVLTTARAVLKDSATRKQVHLIQEHLVRLSGDFDRFRKRMDSLSKHIQQANKDVEEVNTSARKISSRFEKIEKVELHDEEEAEVLDNQADLNEVAP